MRRRKRLQVQKANGYPRLRFGLVQPFGRPVQARLVAVVELELFLLFERRAAAGQSLQGFLRHNEFHALIAVDTREFQGLARENHRAANFKF